MSEQSLGKRLEAFEDARAFSCSKPFSIRRKDPGVFFSGSQCLKRDWDSGMLPIAPQASNGGSGGSSKDCRLPILPVLSGSGKLQLIKFTIFKWILFKFFSFLIVLWRFMRCLFRFYKMFWREGK